MDAHSHFEKKIHYAKHYRQLRKAQNGAKVSYKMKEILGSTLPYNVDDKIVVLFEIKSYRFMEDKPYTMSSYISLHKEKGIKSEIKKIGDYFSIIRNHICSATYDPSIDNWRFCLMEECSTQLLPEQLTIDSLKPKIKSISN